jgi:NAD(P)-dependent dehydrogenase (short-subunit alcohol dehydrogenase family)
MDLGLGDRVVLVTGGSSGIGLATVNLLVAEGALVATCACGERRLREAVAHLDQRRVLAVTRDVTDPDAAAAVVEATTARFGRLDALVNNAGAGRLGRLEDLTDAHWRAELEAKIFGVLNTTRAAVSNLSRGLAAELVTRGILVNTVAVGVIATGRVAERHREEAPEVDYPLWLTREAARRGIPLGRKGTPAEVAAPIAFLASPMAGYISGATLTVAGGLGHAW